MPFSRLLAFAALFTFCLAAVAGCLPSDEQIAAETLAMRQHAYKEWKSARERGDEQSARLNGPLSLDDAIRLALRYNKELLSAMQNREIAAGERMSAYQIVLPSFQVTGNTSVVEGNGGLFDNYSYGLSVGQPIAQGASYPAQLRQARLLTALTDEQIRAQVQTLIQTTATYYYDVLLAQHMVNTQREGLVSAEAQLRMVTERRRQETATDYDVLRAQVDVATYRARMIQAQNDIDSGRVNLLKVMGVSQDSEITFSDKLEFLPMRPVFERAVQIASANRADLRIAELNARSEQEAVRIAQSQFFPVLAATAGNTRINSRSGGLRPTRTDWSAGLNFTWDIGIDLWGNLRSARAEEIQRQIDLLDVQETTVQEIRLQMYNLVNSEEMVKALEVNQDAASEALRLVLVGYQAGVRTEVDVTDARRALTEVQGDYYTALYNHTRNRLDLQVAMGILGPALVSDCDMLAPTVPIANIEEFAVTDYTPNPISLPDGATGAAPGGSRSGSRTGTGTGSDGGRGTGSVNTNSGSGGATTPGTTQTGSRAPVRGSRSSTTVSQADTTMPSAVRASDLNSGRRDARRTTTQTASARR
ncbi:MAG: TolC family protein [Planctomycetaceae bacterium]|nr:TolC family protein [Planctomycetaceae bacterium]